MRQFVDKVPSVSKDTFVTLFLILVLLLMFFPFMATFNDLLTRIVINFKGYWFIREVIVPFEVRVVAVVLAAMGFDVGVTKEYVVLGTSAPFIAEIVWNCIGWQSILFFAITAFVGLQGDKYTNFSKAKALVIGALGTFLINILRIVVVVISAYYFGQLPATIIHDYGSILAFIAWLFFFWWFSYAFVLEQAETVDGRK
ncbi:exosortase/archaeosortase family protein [Candidatus Curtissbacteria bacterium]|nr:exosortase/archaeosortase family protein [Candidatus Curtissbacteria bacterium]